MRRGDFAAAWRVSDAVLAARDPRVRDDPAEPYHLRWVWDGRPFAGRRVLVRCYHGLGDTIQFARFLPLLRPQVAALDMEVQPELAGLLAGVPGPDRLIPFEPAHPLPPSECDIEIMELAHALRVAPGPAPYLCVPAAGRPRNRTGFRVGLCWAAGGWDPRRSVPFRALSPLGQVPGVRLVSLQRGPAAADGPLPDDLAGDDPMDVCATARLMQSLDLVVTVDTMVAHLAGALGRPTWLLLQADADWRWMAGRDDSPWYPAMRLYRQDAPGDWRSPLARLHADLHCLVTRPSFSGNHAAV